MSLDDRAKYMARQGQAFATADEARIIHTDSDEDLRDVPADGKTVGEIVVRGNIVMKEVGWLCESILSDDESVHFSTSVILRLQRKRSREDTFGRVTWLCGTQTAPLLSQTGARILLLGE